MTLDIKDEWLIALENALYDGSDGHFESHVDGSVSIDAHRLRLRPILEAIAPAIYEAGLRAGLDIARRIPTEHTFEEACLYWRGRILTGQHAHCCPEWDELPIDETTPEWPCECPYGVENYRPPTPSKARAAAAVRARGKADDE